MMLDATLRSTQTHTVDLLHNKQNTNRMKITNNNKKYEEKLNRVHIGKIKKETTKKANKPNQIVATFYIVTSAQL